MRAGQKVRAPQVEPVTTGQRVQDGARHHQRPVSLPPIGVGLDVRAVDDSDGTAPDHLKRVVGVNDGAGVLVHADTEQRRGLGDQGEQPADPPALLEVLVDDHALQDAETGRELRHPVLGVTPGRPKATMCVAMALAPAVVPASTAPRSWARNRASPSWVPATTWVSRDWFPPARNTPVASCMAATAAGSSASSRSSGRSPVTFPMPSP